MMNGIGALADGHIEKYKCRVTRRGSVDIQEDKIRTTAITKKGEVKRRKGEIDNRMVMSGLFIYFFFFVMPLSALPFKMEKVW